MDPTVAAILQLLPIATKVAIQIGDELIKVDTSQVTRDDIVASIEASKSHSWPQFEFASTRAQEDLETAS